MSNEALKPCLFCGEKGKVDLGYLDIKLSRIYWVVCYEDDCEVRPQTKSCNTKTEAIAAWNKRVKEKL